MGAKFKVKISMYPNTHGTVPQEQAADFQRRTTETLESLTPTPLRALALQALALYGEAWDYEIGADTVDEVNATRFFEVIDQIHDTPARTAHDAAAKAIVITLLYECDFPGDAQSLSAGLISDLAGADWS